MSSLTERIQCLDINHHNSFNMSLLRETMIFDMDSYVNSYPTVQPSEMETSHDEEPRELIIYSPIRREIPTVLIYGHSFIRRLNYYLTQTKGSYHNLGLDFDLADVEWFSLGGLRADYAYYEYMDVLTQWKPKILYLQLGSNDLCSVGASAQRVSDYIEAIAQLALSYGVEHVIVGSTFMRKGRGIPRFTPGYNYKVSALNLINARRFAHNTNITFWKHHGFKAPTKPVMCRDGVHLNRSGQKKYYRSVRGAILVALRRLNYSFIPLWSGPAF